MNSKDEFQNKAVTSISLDDALLDFILSREAMLCSAGTTRLYTKILTPFIKWLKENGLSSPKDIEAKHIRLYLANLAKRGLSSSYVHCNARNIKTLIIFCLNEGYINQPIRFEMPRLAKKALPYLTVEQLHKVFLGCTTPRDKALILLMTDTGLRRAEICDLTWNDINLKTGIVLCRKGKGNKARTVVIGVKTRRALLAYSHDIHHETKDAVFQTKAGTRLTDNGLRSLLIRIGNNAGIHLSPHMLRRTFATLALKAGMSIVHIQGLLGHASIEQTRSYIQSITEDVIEAHHEHSPIDSFI